MTNLYLLLSPRFFGFKNGLARPGSGKRKRTMVILSLGLLFCSGLFMISSRVLIYFQSVEVIGDVLARYLLSMVLLTFFSLLVFSHIITAISNLYLSKDLEFCHSTPVPLEEVFITRALHSFMDSSWMLVVFGFPVFLAYAYVYRPGIGFYFNLLHINLAMAVIAACIGIIVTMILVYVFPAQRARDIIVLLSLLMIVGLYLLFRFMRPERLVNPDAFFSVMQYLNSLKAPQSPYIPTQWVTKILWEGLKSSPLSSYIFEIVLTWSTAGALFVINIIVATKIYFKGFSKSQEAKRRRMGGKKFLDLSVKIMTWPFKRDAAGLIGKDVRTFFRDNTQWSQLLLLGALVIVYVYNFTVLPLDMSPIRLDFLQNQLAFFNLGLAGFVLAAISSRFVFTSISAEGEAYWLIRSSPMNVKQYLKAKFLFFLLPMIILGEILILATNYLLEVTGFMMILSSLTMFVMVFGIIALGIGFGAMYPRFKFENISQLSTGYGGVLYMIVSAIYIVLIIVIEAGPVYIFFMADLKGRSVTGLQWLFIVVSFSVILAINLFVMIKPLKMGIKSLTEYGS
ncbi:hypothetical protein ACFL2O_02795 [Thermodesulfobacteriota bacterium]